MTKDISNSYSHSVLSDNKKGRVLAFVCSCVQGQNKSTSE